MNAYFGLATLVTLPWVGKIILAAQATPPNAWEIGKDITFAGLVWFLIGFTLPNVMRQHKEEREAQETRHAEERKQWQKEQQ